MMKSPFFRNTFFVIFLFGQNSVSSAELKTLRLPSKFRYFPRIFFLMLKLLMICHLHDFLASRRTEFVLIFGVILVEIIMSIENFFHSKVVTRLQDKFDWICNYLNFALNITLQMGHFKRELLAKVSVMNGGFLFALVTRWFIGTQHFRPIDPVFFVAISASHFAAVHMLLYVDGLRFILWSINQHFETLHYECTATQRWLNVTELCSCMKQYKFVYYELWKINRLINERFGYSVIGISLCNAELISYNLYWVLIYSATNERANLMRKYKLC